MRNIIRVVFTIGTLSMLVAFLGCSEADPPTATPTREEPTINVTQTVEARATENAEVARQNEADRKTATAEHTPEPTVTREPTATPELDRLATREAVSAERTAEAEETDADKQIKPLATRARELGREHNARFAELNGVMPVDPELRTHAETLVADAWDVCLDILDLAQQINAITPLTERVEYERKNIAVLELSCESDEALNEGETTLLKMISLIVGWYDIRLWDKEQSSVLLVTAFKPPPPGPFFYLDYEALMERNPDAFNINNGSFTVYYHGQILEIFNTFRKEQPIYLYRIALFGKDDEQVIAEIFERDCGTHRTKNGLSNEHNLCHYWPEVGDFIGFDAAVRGLQEYTSMEQGDPRHGDRFAMEQQMGFYDDLPGDEYIVPRLLIYEVRRIARMHSHGAIGYEYRFEDGEWSTVNQP